MNRIYYPVSEYYKKKYGEKVYKLPIKLDLTCPNRDGSAGYGGCIYCSESGGSFENLPSYLNIKTQIEKNKKYIGKKYSAKKFIAYFQNFTNTYMGYDVFKELIDACDLEDIVGISISTRSDCISEDKLQYLYEFKKNKNMDIDIELGLQTANYHTLDILNRKEDLADFISAVLMIKKYGFDICTHVILSLPWDDLNDVIETARILNSLKIDKVKIHSLYIVKGTVLEKLFLENKITMISKEDFIVRVSEFLRRIDKNTAVERLIGRAPEEETIFCNWNTSWWVIRDEIENYMQKNGFYQGQLKLKKDYKVIRGLK
ncbi:MAG: TIGR01212 family radical SAM protein [Peptoniphilaceae bacterium]|nr:TIGR01212 family radical SAM protein [Peptoniphilaceae bacterium]MDD7382954.1 TIGR01212 family radical SAM protein [Peptoniphilaceae bacterium]MDY3737705.1 TIGR01212 family radical SAM protein [Peptoniphilaceae bacterium]